MKFTVKNKSGMARTGLLELKNGNINTPAFIPVATKATVKTLSKDELEELGIQILMCNTYHLFLKPGSKLISELGGLHKFMNWDRPIITDSGGFQAFSLGFGMEHKTGKIFPEDKKIEKKDVSKLAKISEEGIKFKSVYDNSEHFLTPETSIKTQNELGADIILALDECTSPLSGYDYTKESLERTHRWAKESKEHHKNKNQVLFGIIQGGMYEDLRNMSTEYISSLGFEGFSIGGSLGRSKKDMHNILEWIIPKLPEEKPKHLLGIGTIEDLFECIKRGIDLFDCVGPTRIARAGFVHLYPKSGGNKENKFRCKITNHKFQKDAQQLDPNCDCKMCKYYTRAYVHHLFKTKELLAYKIVTYHNLHFFLNLVKNIRSSIEEGNFEELMKKWLG